MANTHETLSGLFTAIADAIRGKTGGTAGIVADQFPQEIAAITTGYDTSDATAWPSDLRKGVTAYARGEKIIGTLQNTYSFCFPDISFSSRVDVKIESCDGNGIYTTFGSSWYPAGRTYTACGALFAECKIKNTTTTNDVFFDTSSFYIVTLSQSSAEKKMILFPTSTGYNLQINVIVR